MSGRERPARPLGRSPATVGSGLRAGTAGRSGPGRRAGGGADTSVDDGAFDRLGTRLWIVQRATAVLLAACVVVHLATILYATRGGLTAAEILARTRGSAGWLAFYAVFVVAVAIHAAIGLRTVVAEWSTWRGRSLDWASAALAALLLAAGWRAVSAVFGG